MRRPFVRRSILGISVVLLLVAGFLWIHTPVSCFPPVPQPNGYAALTRVSAQLRRPPEGRKQLSTEQFAESMATNRAALEELRRSLPLASVVPVQCSQSWITAHTPELMNLKTAAAVLDADAELRQRLGDTHGALLAALDQLRLSEAIQQGGVLIDFLVGSACETIACRRMTNLISALDAEHCRQAIQTFKDHDARRESIGAIQKREKEWSRRAFGAFARIGMMIRFRSLNPDKAVESLIPNAVSEYNSRTREARLTLLRLAARAYTLERGIPPVQAADLVPAYLQQLPADPKTGKPLSLP